MNCERFIAHLPGYLADELAEDVRVEWRSHLAGCTACRADAVAHEPSLALSVEPPPTVSADAVEHCVAGVMSRIRQDGLERRLGRSRGRWLVAAAVLVGCLGVAQWVPDGGDPPVDATPGVAAQPPIVELEMGPDVVMYQLAESPADDTVTALIVNPALEL